MGERLHQEGKLQNGFFKKKHKHLKVRSILTSILISSFLIVGCSSKETQCEETNELTIEPGHAIGPYNIGMRESELLDVLCNDFAKDQESALIGDNETTYYFIQNMSFIVRNKRVVEVNVWGTFKGTYEDLGVDYDKESLEEYGEVIKHKGEYRILDIPGIAFGFEDGDAGKYIKIF